MVLTRGGQRGREAGSKGGSEALDRGGRGHEPGAAGRLRTLGKARGWLSLQSLEKARTCLDVSL